MSVSGGAPRRWAALRQLPARTPLRVKILTAVLALVSVALIVISLAGISVIRSYLLGHVDSQLQAMRAQAVNPARHMFGGGAFGNPFTPSRFVVDAVTPGGRTYPANGSLLVGATGPSVPNTPSWLAANRGKPVTVSAQSGTTQWRVIAYPGYSFTVIQTGQIFNNGTLIVGIDVTSDYATISRLATIDLLVSLAVILGLALVGATVVRRSLRPLIEIEQTAGAIAAGDLTQRVPEHDSRTEVGRLGRSLNTMLTQIETAFRAQAGSEAAARRSEERMRQFVADASHELRTPLTAIRGFAEYYRQRGGVDLSGRAVAASGAAGELPGGASNGAASNGSLPGGGLANGGAGHGGTGSVGRGQLAPADLDRIMRRLEQESSRMGVLVEDMLLLARMDQQRPLEQRTVDLLTLAADAVHDARVVAPGRSINLTVGAGAALLVLGDEVRLRQVIGNLMSNALAHTPDGTPIDVRIRSGSLAEAQAAAGRPAGPPPPPPPSGSPALGSPAPGAHRPGPAPAGPSAAVLEVTDHGPGLTREQAEHAFERFYRADAARTTSGTGLGLAIVAALVTAHGGAVWVESAPGAGATFRIALPLAPEALALADDPAEDDESDDPGATDDPGRQPGRSEPDATESDIIEPGSSRR
jgi:two-component system, OmpR family, sensor kinase